jgi:hypothetical protein
VIIPYLPCAATKPIPSLGGSLIRYRPVMAVRLTYPSDEHTLHALVASGAKEVPHGSISGFP